MRRLLPAAAIVLAAGCGSSGPSTGSDPSMELSDAVGVTTSPYAILDLTTGAVSFRREVPDLAANAAYRDSLMVFRRVGSGGSQALIGVFELSQAQCVRLGGGTPWIAVDDSVVDTATHGPTYPAYNLAAEDLRLALAAFNPASGVRLGIPNARQWQAAAGGGSEYAWGGEADRANLVAHAVVRETVLTAARTGGGQIDSGGPSPVGSRSPTNGIYDLHGNVWEWVDDGTAVRGGSWYDPASLARIAAGADRDQGLAADIDHALIGARLVLYP